MNAAALLVYSKRTMTDGDIEKIGKGHDREASPSHDLLVFFETPGGRANKNGSCGIINPAAASRILWVRTQGGVMTY